MKVMDKVEHVARKDPGRLTLFLWLLLYMGVNSDREGEWSPGE